MAIIFQQNTSILTSGDFTVGADNPATIAASTVNTVTLYIKTGATYAKVQQYSQAAGAVGPVTLSTAAETDVNTHKITSPGIYRMVRNSASPADEVVLYTQ